MTTKTIYAQFLVETCVTIKVEVKPGETVRQAIDRTPARDVNVVDVGEIEFSSMKDAYRYDDPSDWNIYQSSPEGWLDYESEIEDIDALIDDPA